MGKQTDGRAAWCPRCHLRTPANGPCRWCGHDRADATHAAELGARHDAHRGRRRDRALRNAWLAANRAHPFGTCHHCHRFTSYPVCEWCGFDASDDVALDAHARHHDHLDERAAARREARRQRWRSIQVRIAPPSRRAELTGTPEVRRFMTCPACHQWSTYGVCQWCDFDATDHEAVEMLDHETRFAKARWCARRDRAYSIARGLIRFDAGEHARLIVHLLKWIVLGTLVGVLAGLGSAAFLATLEWATEVCTAHPWLIGLLPLSGLVVGLAYHHGGGRSIEGNNLILDEIHEPQTRVPWRMAPLVFFGTVMTHLFGGSAGREGTAIQMSGSLSDGAARLLRLNGADRRTVLIAALAGGFGSVFGVPLAGAVFGLEVQAVGRIRYEALVPCLTASVVGDMVVRGLGIHHTALPKIGPVGLDVALLGKVAVAGLVFGLASVLFSELTHGLKRAFTTTFPWMPARPVVGGVVVIALTLAVGNQAYNGLSLGLIAQSFAGDVSSWSWLLKLVFTAVTLGAFFQGGEVTPLFVIGAALGAALSGVLGVPLVLMTALGFVAVFAGAANTPLACTIMGVELFGSGALVYFAAACVVSYVFSSHRGIYGSQRVAVAKGDDTVAPSTSLHDVGRGRSHWLPAWRRKAG